ncbi:D-allose transporter substrate-binding protein [Acetanaerobacterium elongatum]|uniref:Allose-binding protein n=1 Tax=Acetanaerobacterium elongatum TaxID=258515 RepID=A0A1H0GZ98_9FIRM|nr:D-allose transporter substrate-binding protein [Acetanaerobacterium elongatum]SDO12205.1 allose-binding protein [Acetanaerobacterium elongatum]
MKKRIVSVFFALALFSSVLAGCTPNKAGASSAAASSGASAPAESSAPSSAAVSSTAATGEAEYAVVLKTQASDFWVKMKDGIVAKANELGIKVDVYAAQSEEDTEGQLKILENCLTKNYKAIGVAPLSPVNLIPGVVKANQKGIYVMNIDEKIDMNSLKSSGGSVIGFATTDNVQVGKKGAEYIISKLPEGGKVAIIEGKAGNASGESRKQGATDAFKANNKFSIVGSLPGDWDRQKALDVATSFIQSNPDLKGIYCCNDTMALGALQAVINAKKLGQIIVVGTDGDAEAVKSINDGQLSATVAQDPGAIGAKSLEEMVKAVKNQAKIDSNVEPAMIPIESNLITKK